MDSGIFLNFVLKSYNFFNFVSFPTESGSYSRLVELKINYSKLWQSPIDSGSQLIEVSLKFKNCRHLFIPILFGNLTKLLQFMSIVVNLSHDPMPSGSSKREPLIILIECKLLQFPMVSGRYYIWV